MSRIECNALPGSGTCSAMFTACTMASAVEALGMVVPGTASHPAVTVDNVVTDQKKRDCVDSVSVHYNLHNDGYSLAVANMRLIRAGYIVTQP